MTNCVLCTATLHYKHGGGDFMIIQKPEIKVIRFGNDDIIATSGQPDFLRFTGFFDGVPNNASMTFLGKSYTDGSSLKAAMDAEYHGNAQVLFLDDRRDDPSSDRITYFFIGMLSTDDSSDSGTPTSQAFINNCNFHFDYYRAGSSTQYGAYYFKTN